MKGKITVNETGSEGEGSERKRERVHIPSDIFVGEEEEQERADQ
jgi:hypothetical protein